MKVDADDFRRVYENMNDDALLAVQRDDLVELAQQCYDVELARRGLAAGIEPDADAAETAGEAVEMVEIATFQDVDDARMARDLLRAAEIPCQLDNIDPLAGLGGFCLAVPPDCEEQAREVLETEISDEELAAQAEAAGEPEEPEEEEQPD